MKILIFILFSIVCTVGLVSCTTVSPAVSDQQVRDIAWKALEPHTASHKLENWEYVSISQVTGKAAADIFKNEQPSCVWPTPVADAPISSSAPYWLVEMKPRPVTVDPKYTPLSVTAPPPIPEPFAYQAFILIDAANGNIVARRILCVVY